jgi:hypothetical protein
VRVPDHQPIGFAMISSPDPKVAEVALRFLGAERARGGEYRPLPLTSNGRVPRQLEIVEELSRSWAARAAPHRG